MIHLQTLFPFSYFYSAKYFSIIRFFICVDFCNVHRTYHIRNFIFARNAIDDEIYVKENEWQAG